MNFSWTDEQAALLAQALRFAKDLSVAPEGIDDERRGALLKRCAEFGLMGLSVPEELGGLGLDSLTSAGVLEAFGEGCADAGLLFSTAAHLFACVMPIVEYGPEPLRSELVPQLASGAFIGANAMTEPAAGSDTGKLATVAVPDGDDYIITGDKSYVTNGPIADVFLVYATTDPKAGYLGTSAFVVRRDIEGLRIGKSMDKLGLHNAPLSTVYLDECRVSASSRLGAEGQGARIFARSMHWERTCLFAIFVGAMRAQLAECIAYARSRRQFGKPIARNQAVSHRIADMKLRLESARLLLYQACWQQDRGGVDTTLEVSLAKLAVAEAAIASGLDAIRIHGGIGYSRESGVASRLCDALGSMIFSGTSDIQRELICHRLGLVR